MDLRDLGLAHVNNPGQERVQKKFPIVDLRLRVNRTFGCGPKDSCREVGLDPQFLLAIDAVSEVGMLAGEARVAEIARMLGGSDQSQASLAHARELLGA